MNKAKLLAAALTLSLLPAHAMALDIDSPADYSAAGAVSLGYGLLNTLAAPVVVSSQPELVRQNGLIGASVQTVGTGLSATGTGIVMLVTGTGKGIEDLSTNAFLSFVDAADATAKAVDATTPRVSVEITPQQEREIPLKVRKDCVQMHEKVQ